MSSTQPNTCIVHYKQQHTAAHTHATKSLLDIHPQNSILHSLTPSQGLIATQTSNITDALTHFTTTTGYVLLLSNADSLCRLAVALSCGPNRTSGCRLAAQGFYQLPNVPMVVRLIELSSGLQRIPSQDPARS